MKQLSILAEKEKIIEQLLLDNNRLMLDNKDAEKENNRLMLDNKDAEKENNRLMLDNKDAEKENKRLTAKVFNLQFQLEQFKKLVFGRKSEKLSDPPQYAEQPGLFDSQQLDEQEAPSPEKQKITYHRNKASKKKKPVRGALPEHLRRVIHVILPKGDLSNMVKIGVEVTEELEFIPGEIFVKRYVVVKYAEKTPSKDGSVKIIKGILPSRPIEKGIPGPCLLSHLIVSKFADHLPVYRQIQMFKREGYKLSKSTIYGWFAAIGRVLEPLYEELKKHLFVNNYIMGDETPIRILDSNKKNTTHRGWHWVYFSPLTGLVCFDYREGRTRAGPLELLDGFKGYLQTDGYVGYEVFEKNPTIQLLGCMAHARRKFIEAEMQDPVRAKYVLKRIQGLYGIEKKCREEKLDAQQIQKERTRLSVPILKELKEWLSEQSYKVTPKSAIGKAIAYSLKRWDKLSLYTVDGRLQIDNNLVENQIRAVALGRKNYLFAGSHQAAKYAAIYYSLLGSCKHKGINPKKYFTHVLTNIHDTKINELESLLPNNIII